MTLVLIVYHPLSLKSYGNKKKIALIDNSVYCKVDRVFYFVVLIYNIYIMKRKSLFLLLSLCVFFIFSLNFAASKLYWYSSIWWFDVLMHFLGGFWLGLVFLWLIYKDLDKKNLAKDNFIKIVLGVLFVGFGWEIYEIVVNDLLAKNTFDLFDTSTDMIADLMGGISAYLIFKNISKRD